VLVVVVIADMTVHFGENSERLESDIIAKFKAAFGGVGRLIANGASLLRLGQRNSMSALFLCENGTGLKNLDNVYNSGKMLSMLEEIFTNLFQSDNPQVMVHIKKVVWESADRHRCSSHFKPLPTSEFIIYGHIVYL